MCVFQGIRRSLQDVKAKRGADVASDHQLVVARLKLRKNWTGETCQYQRFNNTLLKDIGKQEDYRLAFTNSFQVFQERLSEETIDMNNGKR
jgi:hypothetical protein